MAEKADSKGEPAPAPAAPERRIESPLDAWVRGGTTTSAYDQLLAAQHADAERRRAEQDAAYSATRVDPAGAKIRSMKLGGPQSHPSLVFGIRHPRDNVITDWMISELWSEPKQNPDGSEGLDMTFSVRCPRCVYTFGRDNDEANFHVRQSNRLWHLDDRNRGQIWTDGNETVILAGVVHLDEWAHCPGLGCNWTFKIDGVREVNRVPCSGVIRTR